MLLEKDGVSRVALVQSVREVAHERYKADDEVEGNVHHHHHPEGEGEASVDVPARLDDHQSKRAIERITSAVEVDGISSEKRNDWNNCTYNGSKAITLLQPNLIPHRLKRE